MRARSLVHLTPRALLGRLTDLLAREREVAAELILYLAEVQRRRLHVVEGYPSMHAFCVGALGMSEDSAGKRIRAAYTARRFPRILAMIADGRLHLSAVCLLSKHLTHENAAGLLEAATHRTKRQIELMLAERFPQDDVPAVVRALVPIQTLAAGESVPGRSSQEPATPGIAAAPGAPAALPDPASGAPGAPAAKSVPGRIPDNSMTAPQASPPAPAPSPWPRVAPLAPQRYAVQFTMDQAMHDDLTRTQALLGHAVASGDLAGVFRRALRELVVKLEKQKFAATNRPKTGKCAKQVPTSVAMSSTGATSAAPPVPQAKAAPARHIPARARREVWARDRGRCTFVSASGRRCDSREAVEFDHIVPLAKGGTSTVANLRLRCRAHNQYEAELAFGEGFMHEVRERARSAPSALEAVPGNSPAPPPTPPPSPPSPP